MVVRLLGQEKLLRGNRSPSLPSGGETLSTLHFNQVQERRCPWDSQREREMPVSVNGWAVHSHGGVRRTCLSKGPGTAESLL